MRVLPFSTEEEVERAADAVAEVVRGGGVVLLPTETFYGLGADPSSAAAIETVLALKGRPAHLALPVLCSGWLQVDSLVEVPGRHRERLELLWPGPLTAVLRCRRRLPAAQHGTLGVRIPGHRLLCLLLERVGPLSGTSANLHSRPPATDPRDALATLLGEPELLLDGGATAGGRASTVIDLTGEEPRLLREGPLRFA